jgi:hypothetical protein
LSRAETGMITFSFRRSPDERWCIEASHVGTALASDGANDDDMSQEPRYANLSIDVAKAFASLLGGTVKAISTGSRGVLGEASLPLGAVCSSRSAGSGRGPRDDNEGP